MNDWLCSSGWWGHQPVEKLFLLYELLADRKLNVLG